VSNIRLDFDGTAIGRNGVDGPYEVADLLIGGPETLTVPSAFLTPAFPVSAFEGFVPPSGPPRIVGRIQSVTSLGAGQFRLALQVMNSGTGPARSVFIRQVTFRVLAGPSTAVISLAAPLLPISAGDLSPGASTTVLLTVNVPAGVTRFSITETGTVLNQSGVQSTFTAAQSAILP
jgi:hypothetical protein